MFFPINLASIEIMNLTIMVIVIYLIVFLIGIFFMRWYAANKEYDAPLKDILLINLISLFINISLSILFLYLFHNNLIFDIFILGLNIVIGSFIFMKFFEKEFEESLIFITIIHAALFIIALSLGLFFGISSNIDFYLQTLVQPSNRWLLLAIIIPIIGFFLGILLMRSKMRKKKWDNAFIIPILVSILWSIIDIPLIIILFHFSYENLFFNFLIISFINILIGMSVFIFGYHKEIKESLELASFVQSILIGIFLVVSIIVGFFTIFNNLEVVVGEPLLDQTGGSMLTFLFSAMLILVVSFIFVYWGDKIQLVQFVNLIALISILPGISYVVNSFFIQLESYIDHFILNTIIGLIYSITSGFILKRVSYSTISFQEIRELTILEEGMNLLQVTNLKVYYPLIGGVLKRQIGAVKAVDGISFGIKTGETLGLVGESGCGKTTVAKAVLGLVEKEEGDIMFRNESLLVNYSSYFRQKIQIIFQDPDASLNPRMKVVDIVAEPLRNLLGITNKTEIRKYVLRLMEEVSLKREHMDRYPHEFSGGQKQRIIIARALACNPELIILDEPTSALDVSVQAQILNLLKNLQKTYRYGFLFITHNLAVVNHIADRIAVMYLGQLVEIGDTEQIFKTPMHPYTKALLASRTEIDPYNQEISFVLEGEVPSPIFPPIGCPFNPRCSSDAKTKECEIKFPNKIEVEEGHFIWCVNPSL